MHIHNQLQEGLPLNHHMTDYKVHWQCTTKMKRRHDKEWKIIPLLFLSCGLVLFFALSSRRMAIVLGTFIYRSVITLVIIHRREERAFFIGCYGRVVMLIIKMEAIN